MGLPPILALCPGRGEGRGPLEGCVQNGPLRRAPPVTGHLACVCVLTSPQSGVSGPLSPWVTAEGWRKVFGPPGEATGTLSLNLNTHFSNPYFRGNGAPAWRWGCRVQSEVGEARRSERPSTSLTVPILGRMWRGAGSGQDCLLHTALGWQGWGKGVVAAASLRPVPTRDGPS